MHKFFALLALAAAAAVVSVTGAGATPPRAIHVYGSGSSQWGGPPHVATQSFSLNVFSTPAGGLGGHMSWHGVTDVSYPFRLDFSGHPSCLAVSPDGQLAVAVVVRYIRSEQSWVGPIEIIQAGSPELAMSELLETDSRAGAESICSGVVNAGAEGLPPLAELNGQVTIVN